MRLITLLVLLLLYTAPSFAKDEGEIGHYTMNGVTFAIPKKALLVSMPEGEVDGSLPILLRWPNLEPAQWKGDQSQVIAVSVMPYKTFTRKIGNETVITNTIESYYQSLAHIFIDGKNNQILGIKAEPYFMAHHAISGLNGYKMPYSGHFNTLRFDFFIEGNDPIHPQYWVACEFGKCTSYNKITNKIMAEYTFNRIPFFTNTHQEMRSKVTTKIQSFIIDN